jgi:uncharacterized protein YndB with AHSA1/START domain
MSADAANDPSTTISVTRVVSVPAQALFALLADPARHGELDGSGTVRAAVSAGPVTAVGDVFRMSMHRETLGDYETENRVVAFEPGRLIAWAPGRPGRPGPGHTWCWEVEAVGETASRVTHTYDWSGVTDPRTLEHIGYPQVSADQMSASVDRLADLAG